MKTEKVVEEFYFSQLLQSRIYNRAGNFIGRIGDVAVYPGQTYPKVAGICCGQTKRMIPMEQIAYCGKSHIILTEEFFPMIEEKNLPPLIYLGKRVLDKQLIDVKGAKLVRVNDVILSWVGQQNRRQMLVTAVDIGIRGLFRRLGMEFLLRRLKNKLLGWQYITILEEGAEHLQIGEPDKKLGELQPVNVAHIIEELDYKRRMRFIENLRESQVCDAFSLLGPRACKEVIGQMDAAKAARILSSLPKEKAERILLRLGDSQASCLRLAVEKNMDS